MRITRAVAVAAPALAVTAMLTAAPAFAKSDVSIAVSAHHAEVGSSVRVTASGDNDAQGRYTQVCVQLLRAHHWHDLRCSKPTSDASQGVSITTHVERCTPATLHLRARLVDYAPHSRHRHDEQRTPTITVRFTA